MPGQIPLVRVRATGHTEPGDDHDRLPGKCATRADDAPRRGTRPTTYSAATQRTPRGLSMQPSSGTRTAVSSPSTHSEAPHRGRWSGPSRHDSLRPVAGAADERASFSGAIVGSGVFFVGAPQPLVDLVVDLLHRFEA